MVNIAQVALLSIAANGPLSTGIGYRRYHPHQMSLSRLTLGRVALAWIVFLWGAALVLPNLDSHAQANHAVRAIVAAGYGTLLIGTPIALINYFNPAWRRVGTVPNTTVYVVWLSLESVAAVGFLGVLAYPAIIFAVARLR